MVSKIIIMGFVIAAIIVFSSAIYTQQEVESQNKFKVYKEKFDDVEWNNEITKILPREGDLGREWTLLWSDGPEEFNEGQSPIMIKKTVAGNEILSTSYNYEHFDHGKYQILVWKGKLVSNWEPNEAIENIFHQTDAKIEKKLNGLDLIPNCVVAYYDYYGNEKEIKHDLLFSECAKKDYRIRVNLSEGEFNEQSIDDIVFLSNLAVGKI